MKFNSTSLLWGATVPMWGLSAVFQASAGNTELAIMNGCLAAMNLGICLMHAFNSGQPGQKPDQVLEKEKQGKKELKPAPAQPEKLPLNGPDF